MDNHNRLNLEFLLNATPEVLKDWYDKVDEDDHEYASELLAMYGEELKIKTELLKDRRITSVKQASKILQNLFKNYDIKRLI